MYIVLFFSFALVFIKLIPKLRSQSKYYVDSQQNHHLQVKSDTALGNK